MTLIHSGPADRDRSSLISNAGLAALAGSSALAYAWGRVDHDDHSREAGLLSVEAIADSVIAVEGLKLLTSRVRPDAASSQGVFGHSSPFDSSFPSVHAATAWATAAVLAREYPGPVAQWGAYGLASLISLSRITAEKHFPSDVLVGAAAGYLIGRFVYKTHHDDRMTDRTGSTPVSETPIKTAFSPENEHHRAKSASRFMYIPLDSWIYPALDRLAALGYVPDHASNLAPLTRNECLRQVKEADEFAELRTAELERPEINDQALRLIADLMSELDGESPERDTVRLESLYTRVTDIQGIPVRDSYHFGQTIYNDYGRPYDQGFNNVTGFSGYASSGPVFAYFRGEYQSAPGRSADPLPVRQFIASADENPLQGPMPISSTNRFEPLEMYTGVKLGFENITFGKQNLWWGPDAESAFSFSTNAEAFYMLRFSQQTPLVLPGILSHLGKIRTEILFGKLSGHHWPPRPFVNAQKISLDLTNDFEVGFTRSAFFGGVGHPLTLGNIESSLFSVTSTAGGRTDPGDRHSGFDFRYRIPGLRRYVTVYSDSYADDEPSPIDNPKRSAWAPGLYLAQVPGLRKLDFRFETYSTWLYRQDAGGTFLYFNNQYHDSYTNNGNLPGSWIGRDSRAYVASTTYWFSAKSKLQAKYRQIKAASGFLPGGGTQTDGSITAQYSLNREWMLTATAQYERYFIPILGGPQRDLLGSLQVTFTPANWTR